jgi:peptide/nickel transport system substrate-binding protein
MTDEANKKGPESTRRKFLTATTALAGAAIAGLPGVAGAERKRNPKRGGTVRFGTRDDSVGLDTHRNFIYFVSQPLAGTTGGLLDFDARMEIVPAIATEWEPSKDLTTWTFKLRRGAEFHNGETIDANAVKWNLERILDPKIGHSFNRSALIDVDRITVDDKYIVQVHLKEPSAAFDSNLVYYPVNLISPGAVDKADTEPAGCGPFKFKSWKRFDICELVRFENFWETDSEGNTLPYLDGLIGRPKKEDRVRLTALRAGELDLIDNVAYADAPSFIKDYGKTYDTYPVPQVGTAMITFNLRAVRSRRRTIRMRTCCAPRRHMPSTMRASTRRCSTSRARSPRASTANRARGTAMTSSRGRSSIPTRPRRCARRPRTATPSS